MREGSTLRHILVGIDLGARPAPGERPGCTALHPAPRAISFGGLLAAQTGARLTVVGRFDLRGGWWRRPDPGDYFVDGLDRMVTRAVAAELDPIRRQLWDLADLLVGQHVERDVQLRIGRSGRVLQRAADARAADLIVVSRRRDGARRPRRWADRRLAGLLHRTKRPVLVLPAPGDPVVGAAGLDSLFHRIAVAVDDSDPSRRAVGEAATLAEATASEVVVVHVREVCPQPPIRIESRTHATQVVSAAIGSLERRAVAARGVVVEADSRRTARAIVAQARRAHTDLIVVGTRGLPALAGRVLGSVAQRVVASASVPVLVVRG